MGIRVAVACSAVDVFHPFSVYRIRELAVPFGPGAAVVEKMAAVAIVVAISIAT